VSEVLRALLTDTTKFSKFLRAATIVKEVLPVKHDPDNITIRCLDAAKVAYAEFVLPSDAFDLYEADDGLVGLELRKVQRFVGAGSTGERLLMKISDDAEFVLRGGKVTKRLTLPLLDAELSDVLDPKLEATVLLEPSEFKRHFDSIAGFGDVVQLRSTPEGLVLRALELPARRTTATIELTSLSSCVRDMELEPDLEASYGIELFGKIVGVASLASEMKLRFGSNKPVFVEYELPMCSVARFALAPRIVA